MQFNHILVIGLVAGFLSGCDTPGFGDDNETLGDILPIPGAGNRSSSSVISESDVDVMPQITVNSYLWRASLDTLSFLPLSSADPFGGVIISEWHEDPESPGERFKVTVYILDQRLRADGIKVAVFRQAISGNNAWADAPVNPNVAIDLENAILTRARQLRIDSAEGG